MGVGIFNQGFERVAASASQASLTRSFSLTRPSLESARGKAKKKRGFGSRQNSLSAAESANRSRPQHFHDRSRELRGDRFRNRVDIWIERF